MKIRLLLLLFVGAFSFAGLNAEPLSLRTFTKQEEVAEIKLSPDGRFLAATMPRGDRTVLGILDRNTLKPTHVFGFPEKNHIDDFYWASNERVVFTRYYHVGHSEERYTEGQIYAGNFDGSKYEVIFGLTAGADSQLSHRMKKNKGPDRSAGKILHHLPNDPEHIIISARHFDNRYDAPVRIIKLNVNNRKKKVITRTPFGNMSVKIDGEGLPVLANGYDTKGVYKSFLYDNSKEKKWVEIKEDSPLFNYKPVSINQEGDKLYLITHYDGKTSSLSEYDFKTKSIKEIFNHPISDIQNRIVEPASKAVVGVEIMPDYFEYHYFDSKSEFAKTHKSLVQAFKGNHITITSRTEDLDEMVVLVKNDKNPGDFYLYDRKKKNVSYLLSRKQWVDPAKMAERKPINFEARDGTKIYGYLTSPLNKKTPSPLVTLVHGGPYGVQDKWFFDEEAQLLANQGFAVLQVNYRGSGGYGYNYRTSAYKKRHTLIQEDIIDGTKWALSLPETTDKACIMGWSFGGYSAVMSPLKEPELFSCAIAGAGLYDAAMQEEEADYSKIGSVAKGAAARQYGTDEKHLKEASPLTYIDNLKTPLFIVHGGADERVPPEHAKLLKEALEKRNMPYEWMFKDKEPHTFRNEDNRIEYYERSIEFLNKYLK